MKLRLVVVLALAAAAVACGPPVVETVYLSSNANGLVGCDTDAGDTVDAGTDATLDDASFDDASADATLDAGIGLDAAPDTGTLDAAPDAGFDAGIDAGAFDSGIFECVQSPGSWRNVTPAGVSLNINTPTPGGVDPTGNYGVQDVVTDPVNPNVLYAFICHQGVWRSVDYGCTWTFVSAGANSSHLLTGRPWTAAIDPSTSRNPAIAPTLWTVNGDGDLLGVYVSTNGGVDWAQYNIGNTTARYGGQDDAYALDVDPTNSAHVITGMHDEGLSESTNGGMTWRTVPVPGAFGLSVYPFFVKGASSPSTTWITQAQWDSDVDGMWRTTNSGTSWTQVNKKLEHDHGSSQIFQNGAGLILASGETGASNPIDRSTDFGVTWHAVTDGSQVQNGVFASAAWAYATRPFADPSGIGQHFQRSSLVGDAGGASWIDWTPTMPFSNGCKRVATTSDGTHGIFVCGAWDAGLWRYVEPLGDGG